MDPKGVVANHDVDDGQQSAHASYHCDFEGFMVGAQSVVEVSQHRVMANAGKRSHIYQVANVSSATIDVSSASAVTAVAIERGDPHQLADLLSVELAQLRQFCDTGQGHQGTDTGHTEEYLVFAFPDRRLFYLLFELLIECLDAIFEPVDMFLDFLSDRRTDGRRTSTILFRGQHLHQLATTIQQRV